MATLRNIPSITEMAFSVFTRSPRERGTPAASVAPPAIFIKARAQVPPSSSKTIETVVEVGNPIVLKISSKTTSVTITARKRVITS